MAASSSNHSRAYVALTVLAAVLAAVAWMLIDAAAKLAEPVDFSTLEYVGAGACRDCHENRHQSWYGTFHRTMTQQAGPDSVQGRFDGRALEFQGIRVRPLREGDDFYFEYTEIDSGRPLNRVRIERTVGSNRYQQYLGRIDDTGTYARLHYLWHNGDQRWVHMNAVFLGPDDQNYDAQVVIWNQNCIFCHNTGIQPGLLNEQELRQRAAAGEPVNLARDTRFDSSVAELGISCESCHGPGETHVARAGEFVQRQAMRLFPGRDASIFNPMRDPVRGSQVCGQCHAQRVPAEARRIIDWMYEGPSYRPGDNLLNHVTPVRRDLRAPVRGQEDMFRPRFWADGTPRLTAYEFQGMRMSEGHQNTDVSCMDCHTMHAGDPRGQMTDRQHGDAPCLRCHTDYADKEIIADHSRHSPESAGARCYSCHMPEIVYGVMDIHRGHRIESPDAVRDAAAGRPNACLNCHLEQSPVWAAEQLDKHWDVPATAITRRDGGEPELAEGATMLYGDPVQKAIIAWRAGQPDNADQGLEAAWKVPWLLAAMGDNYPSTRRFARMSLRELLAAWPDPEPVAELALLVDQFDFTGPSEQRQQILRMAELSWRALDKQHWPSPPTASGLDADYRIPDDLRHRLTVLGRRQDKQIHIGE